jgi:type II secretory pathway pseudopilin PulG
MKIARIVLTVVSLVLVYLIYKGIKDPIDWQKEKKIRYAKVIERLKDIRAAQMAYRSEKGEYAASFDTLIYFLKNGNFTVVKQIGDPEDSTAVVIRDTTYVPVRDSLFKGRTEVIDSLPFVPFGDGATFKMSAGKIEKGNVMVNVFEVVDTKPFDPNHVLKVGSMTEPTNAGNWE